jgi:predicted MPP superfamily phosphohydrolase
MKYKKKSFYVILILFVLFYSTPSLIIHGSLEEKITRQSVVNPSSNQFSPGEIIGISFSNNYPTLGEPIKITLIIKGNPKGEQFNETLIVTNDFQGLVFKSWGAEWKCGTFSFNKREINIGKLPYYIKIIDWYPVIVGNHTLSFKAGDFVEKIKKISVSFDTEHIIFPSIGCPSIISREESEYLLIVVSEDRRISDSICTINKITLTNIFNDSTYTLNDYIYLSNDWILTGENLVEDEIILHCPIVGIPDGFYNITVATAKDEYFWAHAVKIVDEESTKYHIVQLTDTHIGKTYNLIDEKEVLIHIIRNINEEIYPDFIVISGDLIDWYNSRINRNFFIELHDILTTSNSPVYTIPGNHDRYENRLLFLYNPYYDLSNYHRYINPISDYSFEYGDINYIFLDSGYDYSRWEIKLNIWNPTPEGSGLTNSQMYLIEKELGNNKFNQSIIMHHPAVNERDDYGLFPVPDTLPSGNDECIVLNRARFIDYCLFNNISLVLSGHTHNNKILNFLGEESTDLFAFPLFIQTESSTCNRREIGGRVIHVNNGQVVELDYISFLQ